MKNSHGSNARPACHLTRHSPLDLQNQLWSKEELDLTTQLEWKRVEEGPFHIPMCRAKEDALAPVFVLPAAVHNHNHTHKMTAVQSSHSNRPLQPSTCILYSKELSLNTFKGKCQLLYLINNKILRRSNKNCLWGRRTPLITISHNQLASAGYCLFPSVPIQTQY